MSPQTRSSTPWLHPTASLLALGLGAVALAACGDAKTSGELPKTPPVDADRPLPAGASPALAAEITASNATSMLVGGQVAIGGIGDYVLMNDKLHAIVDRPDPSPAMGPPLQNGFAPTGCTLVDLAQKDRGNDQLNQFFQVANLSPNTPVAYLSAETAVDETTGIASVTCHGVLIDTNVPSVFPGVGQGQLPGTVSDVQITTTYRLGPGWQFVQVTTTVENRQQMAIPLFTLTDVFFVGHRSGRSFIPDIGTTQTGTLTGPRGFEQPVLDLSNPSVSLAPFVALAGQRQPGASYALVSFDEGLMLAIADNDDATTDPAMEAACAAAGADRRKSTAETDEKCDVGAQFVAAGPARSSTATIGAGQSFTFRRQLFVGGNNGASSAVNPALTALGASVSDAGFRLLQWTGASNLGYVRGSITPPLAGVDVVAVQTAPAVAFRGVGADGKPLLVPGGSIPYNHAVTDENGRFELVLPIGGYALELRARSFPVTRRPFSVSSPIDPQNPEDLGAIALTAPAPVNVSFEIRERMLSGDSRLTPGRLTVKGIHGTRDPMLGPVSGNDAQAAGNIAYAVGGKLTLQLPPGKYAVWASRGVEFTIDRAELDTSTVNGTTTFTLENVFNRTALGASQITANWWSGDFHVHSGFSFDSSLPGRDRVTAFLGEGVDVVVATEHDFVADYGPFLAQLSDENATVTPPLSDQLATVIGIETTGWVPYSRAPNTVGHWNAFPLRLPAQAALTRRKGAPNDEFLNPATLMDILRGPAGVLEFDDAGTPTKLGIVQCNHPRAGQALPHIGLGYFENMGFDPTQPVPEDATGREVNAFLRDVSLAGATGTDNLRFDTMEILNGSGYAEHLRVRQDWFSLLNQAMNLPSLLDPTHLRKVGTANSDSHRVFAEWAGFPRNYVFNGATKASAIDFDDPATGYNAAVIAGAVIGTNGPFVNFQILNELGGLDSARGLQPVASAEEGGPAFFGLGSTVYTATGRVRLLVQVVAAPWIPVDEVRIVVNGETAVRIPLPGLPDGDFRNMPELRFLAGPSPAPVPPIDIEMPAGDGWLLVEAGSSLDDLDAHVTSPEFYGAIVPGHLPLGFTNPIFVNNTAAGEDYTPPGLGR